MLQSLFKVERLAPAIGAEIHGVDLGKPLDDAAFARIHGSGEMAARLVRSGS